ncbi:hypothetical protein PLEOSDRAFT_1099318 [Pleurotus ostreatus PC15]|uniref:Uncharacterized protein n=1 Tax=Pleurotus ostreatus (strain PC15) TaxID=1137138 RepID=A0A067PBW0_PLEO1|nr:hypothetical protein PLEOSDRAFT_1099318 [Pleurotus ostreatus PC15]
MFSSFRCAPASASQPNNGDHQGQPTQAGARLLRRTSTANSLPPSEDESAPRDNKRKATDDPPVVARDGIDRVDGTTITMDFYCLDDAYKCCTCKQVVKNTSVHIKNQHSKVPFKCENCPSLVLKTQEAFNAHIMDRHPWKVGRIYDAVIPPPAPVFEAPPTKRQKRAVNPAPRVQQTRNDQGGYYRHHTFDGATAPTLPMAPVFGPVFYPGRTPPMQFFASFIAFTKDLSIKDRVSVYVRCVPPLLEFARSEAGNASKELTEAHFHFQNVGIGLNFDLAFETLKEYPSALANADITKHIDLIAEEACK